MAKDKDGKGNEDYDFVPPDFDEDAFIHREMVSFRTTTILFLWGIVAALVSWALFAAVDGDTKTGWLLGMLVAAVFGFALRWLFPRLKADIKHFGRREWLGTGFLFFFTWLAFFIIAVNPPISDYAAPHITLHAGPPVQQAGGDVALEAFFEDNDRVVERELSVTGPGGPVALAEDALGRGHHVYTATGLAPGIYEVTASARDRKGHTEEANLTFAVVDEVLDVVLPDGGALDGPTDQVFVRVGGGLPECTRGLRARGEPCVRMVSLELGPGQRVVLEHDEQLGGWSAVANHAGWSQGPVTFRAVAELMDSYAGNVKVDGGTLVSAPHNLTVSTPTGEFTPKVLSDPNAPQRNVPGVGPVLLAVGLLAAVAVVRRRRGD